MNFHKFETQKSDLDKRALFINYAYKVSEIAKKYGTSVKPFHDRNLKEFTSLSSKMQFEAISGIKKFYKTFEYASSINEELDNNSRALWYSLRELGFLIPNDLFSRLATLSGREVIEIYDLNGIQIWRNFNFLKICSYTLEQMYCLDWQSRYVREKKIQEECVKYVSQLLTEQNTYLDVNMGEYVLQESKSDKQLKLSANHLWLSQLKDRSRRLGGWLVVSRVQILAVKESDDTKMLSFDFDNVRPFLNDKNLI